MPDGKCINVIFGTAREQCAQVIKLLNVQIKLDDLFSRCRNCNAGSFTIINKNQAKYVWFKYQSDESVDKSNDINSRKVPKVAAKPLPDDYDGANDADLRAKIDLNDYTLLKNSKKKKNREEAPASSSAAASNENETRKVKIQIDNLFETTIEVIEEYFICDGCGHIYWEGPHWQHITVRFAHVLGNK